MISHRDNIKQHDVIEKRTLNLLNEAKENIDNVSKKDLLVMLKKNHKKLHELGDVRQLLADKVTQEKLNELALYGMLVTQSGHDLNTKRMYINNAIKAVPDNTAGMPRVQDLVQDYMGTVMTFFKHRPESLDKRCGRDDFNAEEFKEYIRYFSNGNKTLVIDPSMGNARGAWQQVILHVLFGLINNAHHWCDYVTRVSFSEIQYEGRTRNAFIVSDDGPGISEEDEYKLFTPAVGDRDNGHGIGLFLSKVIAEQYRMTLYYDRDSELSDLQGATFVLVA